MSVGHKSSNTQIFRLMVYRRALHPELFDLQSRRMYRHGDYEAEGWVVPGGHVMRFQVGEDSLTETVVENGDHLPETGLVHALPCLGEKDYEMARDGGRTGYVTTIQTESLTDNLYHATYREMRDFALQVEAQVYEWTDPDGSQCMSILDTQKFKKQFHIQSYHLLGASGMVLRTQSIFEVR
jgi:hypothetical protein